VRELDSPGLPHSEESERAVLGAILLDPQLVADVALLPEDFYEARHELIFAAMRHVHDTGVEVDLRTVQARLEILGQFEAVGGVAYLAQLDLDLPDLSRFDTYAAIVKERSLRRQFIRAAQESIRACMDTGAEIADLLDRHTAALEAMRGGAAPDRPEAYDVEAFLALQLTPRHWLAAGLIQDRDILMLHAPRGCGKSHFCFGLAYSLACGVDFLRYEIREPVPVLLCDGEQQAEEIQARLRAIQQSLNRPLAAPFRLLARDQANNLPSLATTQGQAVVERAVEKLASSGPRVLVIDSLSTLASLPKDVSENDEAGWRPIQEWLLRLRARGVTSLFVHHDNKAGAPRGTSAREILPSQIVHLKRPGGYNPSEGARFLVYLEKARGVFGSAARPYEAWLRTGPDGRQVWTSRDLDDAREEAIREAQAEGVTSLRGIVKRTGLPYTTVQRKVKAGKEWNGGG
jgi:AAA domain-containing protein/DnaB helicase-like protein